MIFVDDLDRCLPDKALQVLESAKVFLDAEGYVFVVGLDRSIIEKCVDCKYGKESGISGIDYIKKIIQVPFNLPGLREQEVKTYVQRLRDQLKETAVEEHVEKYLDIISKGMEANPREIKRFVNNFILVNQISASETEPNMLLVLLVIQFRWEGFYRAIAEHKADFLASVVAYMEEDRDVTSEKGKDDFMKHWGYLDLIEKTLDNELRSFLKDEGKILFGIQDLDPYIHFSKAATIEVGKEIQFSWQSYLISLLQNFRIDEFNLVRARPFVDLAGVQLRGAYLNGIDLSGADLSDADLSGIRVEKRRGPDHVTGWSGLSIFEHPTNLENSNLRDANLTRVNLSGVILSYSDLTGANLLGIIIDEETIFIKTIVQNVKNLSTEIRDTLQVEIENGVEKATSRRLMKKE